MKNQRMKSEHKLWPAKGIAVFTMLAVLVCLSAVLVFANTPEGPVPVIDETAQAALGIHLGSDGYWVKEYDGKESYDAALVTVDIPNGTPVTATSVTVENANADANGTRLVITYPAANGTEETIYLPLRIEKKQLAWVGTGKGTEALQYDPSVTEYSVALDLNGAELTGFVAGEGVTYNTDNVVLTVDAVNVTATKAIVMAKVGCEPVGTTDLDNYVIPLLSSEVEILPISITFDRWVGHQPSFHFGTDADHNGIYDALEIVAIAKTASGTEVALKVLLDGTQLTINEAYAAGQYGNVLASSTTGETTYDIVAVVPNELYTLNAEAIDEVKKAVSIDRAVYNVSIVPSASYLTQLDLANTNKVDPTVYQTLVTGEGVPAEFLAQITYSYTNAAGQVVSDNGVSAPGVYTVTATLPTLLSGENNEFCNYELVSSEALVSTLTIKENYLVVGTADQPKLIFVIGENGIPNGVSATVTIPESISRKAIYGYHVHKEYTLQIKGSNGEAYTLLIPIDSALVTNPNCEALTVNDIYVYDGIDSLLAASEKYTVTLSEDGAYYIIEGYDSTAAVTFVIAPAYEAPFWLSAPGIALIILLVLLLLLILFLIGLKVRQIERTDANNPLLTIDTEGDVPTFDPVVIPDKVEDPDAVLAEGIDRLADALRPDVEAEQEALDTNVDATAAVAEALDELHADEAEEVVEAVEEPVEESVVEEAVAEALEEVLEEEPEATEAVAMVEEEVAAESDEDEDNDNDNDDDDDTPFGGFGSMPLEFIDVMVEAEKYNEMLAQEARGEVQLVTRYRRSYQSRLAQSQGSVQDYYNVIKNLLLSYKGIKNRISWNYESFNLGRTQVAKFNAKTRTLYIYMALDPEALAESKYIFADMSSKKKYAAVPVLMKIKGDRKFKHAVEMITMLCEEKLALSKKKVVEEVDYKLPYMTTEAMVAEGLVKKLVAAIPLVTEEPTEAPVEEVAEEVAAVEEIATEEIPADAEVTDTDSTEA